MADFMGLLIEVTMLPALNKHKHELVGAMSAGKTNYLNRIPHLLCRTWTGFASIIAVVRM